MKRMYWKKKKTIAMYLNRRQFLEEFSPIYSAEIEIELESGGVFLITETSTTATPQYIRTE